MTFSIRGLSLLAVLIVSKVNADTTSRDYPAKQCASNNEQLMAPFNQTTLDAATWMTDNAVHSDCDVVIDKICNAIMARKQPDVDIPDEFSIGDYDGISATSGSCFGAWLSIGGFIRESSYDYGYCVDQFQGLTKGCMLGKGKPTQFGVQDAAYESLIAINNANPRGPKPGVSANPSENTWTESNKGLAAGYIIGPAGLFDSVGATDVADLS